MEGLSPTLVLVPPTSLTLPPSPLMPRSSSYPAQHRSSTVVSQRPTSQTTIFSIYSMYEDDRTNWSATHSRKSNEGSQPTVKLKLPDSPKSSVFTPNVHLSTELAYYDSDIPTTPDHHLKVATTDLTIDHSPPSLRISKSEGQMLQKQSFQTSATSSTSPSHFRLSSKYSSDSESSRGSQQQLYEQLPNPHESDLSALPPLPSSSASSPQPTPSATPPRLPSPHLQLPSTPNSLPLKHPVLTPSPSSKISLVPSEGEDMDAFHVRNTYAQLEALGVKGDGYEEGVERTRARIGASRLSQLNAQAAINNGTEKSKELDPREIETLASVDRYGFFSVSSYDRLVILKSTPFAKPLGPVAAATAPNTVTSLTKLPPVRPRPNEASRISKWTRMLQPSQRDLGGNVQSWDVKPSKERKLRPRVYKGVPDSWRGGVWDLLMTRRCRSIGQELGSLATEYKDGLDKPSSYDIQIDLDVPRTISGHIMFRTRYGAGQRSLFHVLHCFSLRCPSCGYVQGMGPIAATLLCYFEPERVYASLVRLHDAYSLHAVFSPGFPGLLEAIYLQERITQQMMPEVYAAFVNHTISTTSYATKWYITLFSNSVPFQTQLRLWDVFLLEGYDVFIAVAVAILWVYRDQLTSSSASFETILSLLSSFFVPENEDNLLLWIYQMLGNKKLRSDMVRWKAEWKGLVVVGKEGEALL